MPRTKAFDESVVLEKARDLFWKRGYTATSIGELEVHLGISRSSLYRFFGGKRELYDKTLARYQHENLGRLRKALHETTDIRKTLETLFHKAAAAQHPNCHAKSRGCYVVNATTEMANSCTDALNFVANNREQFVVIMQDALARAQVQGRLEKQADVRAWADFLFICYNGLQVVVQTKIDRAALKQALGLGLAALPWREEVA